MEIEGLRVNQGFVINGAGPSEPEFSIEFAHVPAAEVADDFPEIVRVENTPVIAHDEGKIGREEIPDGFREGFRQGVIVGASGNGLEGFHVVFGEDPDQFPALEDEIGDQFVGETGFALHGLHLLVAESVDFVIGGPYRYRNGGNQARQTHDEQRQTACQSFVHGVAVLSRESPKAFFAALLKKPFFS